MLKDIFLNKTFILTILSWTIAQGIKTVVGIIKEKRFDFNWILKTGGMPSAHSAAVSSLTVALGKEWGFSSSIFAFACIFALITMFDAQTWRRSIGVQAKILNRMIDDLQHTGRIEETKLKELAGHTPFEVFVGALLGVLVVVLFY